MPNIDEFSWQSSDSLDIYGIDWQVKDPQAVVVLIHGLGEHIHRYHHFASFLGEKQIALVGFDLPGHGRTSGKRGHAPSGMKGYMSLIAEALERATYRYPGKPIILYGHSYGGNLALQYTLNKKLGSLVGVVASAPWIRTTNKVSPLLEGFGRLTVNILPGFLQPNGLDLDKLSRDKAVVKAYQEDPFVHNKISAKAGIEMLDAARWLDSFQGSVNLPTLLMHGSDDGITDPKATIAFGKRVEGPLILKIWDGLYHEIHNEPEQNAVFNYFYEWLKSQI